MRVAFLRVWGVRIAGRCNFLRSRSFGVHGAGLGLLFPFVDEHFQPRRQCVQCDACGYRTSPHRECWLENSLLAPTRLGSVMSLLTPGLLWQAKLCGCAKQRHFQATECMLGPRPGSSSRQCGASTAAELPRSMRVFFLMHAKAGSEKSGWQVGRLWRCKEQRCSSCEGRRAPKQTFRHDR